MRPMQDFGGAFTEFKPEFYIGVRLMEENIPGTKKTCVKDAEARQCNSDESIV